MRDSEDLPAGDPFWLVIATREIVQTTGGSLLISKDITNQEPTYMVSRTSMTSLW
jgi:hypothetical protein